MDVSSINFGYLIAQVVEIVLAVSLLSLDLSALFVLRRRRLATLEKAIWVLIILAIPFLGAIAFWIIQPSDDHPPEGSTTRH